ncbi:hypothetical protein D918_00446 [Trichuris suis]|nr:hypothetical protein D918_00446 [Trichuris suis]
MDPIRHLDKRDFQEHNPVRSEREMFERYDPWVGITIGISLGTMLGLMLANVAVRWVTKRLKRLMRKTKLGRRIFGDELPLVILPTSQMEQVGRIGNALTSSSTASFQSVKSVQPLSYDRSRPNATSSCTNVVTTAMVSASDTKQADP